MSIKQTILDQVARPEHRACTTIGLLTSDLRIPQPTVKRYVTAMLREGVLVEVSDKYGAWLDLSDKTVARRVRNEACLDLYRASVVA